MLITVSLSALNYSKDDILKATGSRAAGMGGAFCAVADDFSSFYWNPAGLVLLERTNVSAFYDSVYKGSQVNFGFNITQPIPQGMRVAATYMHTEYISSIFYNNLLYITFATYLNEIKSLSMGMNIKYLNIGAEGYQIEGSMTSVDAGLLYTPGILNKKLKFGVFIQDLDATFVWNNNVREKVPVQYKFGSSYSFDPSSVIDLDFGLLQTNGESDFSLHFGGEKWFKDKLIGNFGLRAGFVYQDAYDPVYTFTFGLSYSREDFIIDYVFIPDYRSLGETHKINFSYRVGESVKDEKVIIKPVAKKIDTKVLTGRFADVTLGMTDKYVSPNKDGNKDTVRFMLNDVPGGTGNMLTELEIFDPKNTLIRSMKHIGKVPEYLEWNGLNEDAIEVNDGDYTARIRIRKENEIMWEKFKVVTVDKTPPACQIRVSPKVFAPHPSSLVKNMDIRISTKFKDIKSWTLIIKDEDGNAIKKLNGEGFTKLISWNGKDALGDYAKNGRFSAEMIFEDFAGNRFDIKDSFSVDTDLTKYSVNTDKKIFKSGTDNVRFNINLSEPSRVSKWQLDIMENDNTVIMTYKDRGPGVKSVTWYGTNAKNVYVREGRSYKYRVTVYQKSGMASVREGVIQAGLPDFKATGIKLTLAAVKFNEKDKYLPIEEYTYLNQAAEAINKYATDYFVFIKGFSDDFNSAEKNLEISIQRARAVEDYLVAGQGVPAENIFVVGFGDGDFVEAGEKMGIENKGIRVEVELLTK